MGPVLAFFCPRRGPRNGSSREPVESIGNLQDRIPRAGIGQLPSHLPRLLGSIEPFQGFIIRDRHHRVLPSLLDIGPLTARPSLPIGCLTVTRPQPVPRRPAISQPRARVKKARPSAAPLRASVLWRRRRLLIEINRDVCCAVRRDRGILRMCKWSLASPARLLFGLRSRPAYG
jgi:hypothetical protein